MGGNFAVRREIALRLGGFDEQFVRVAYNFEAEFAYRLSQAGCRIFYEPTACIHHLQSQRGGYASVWRSLEELSCPITPWALIILFYALGLAGRA